MRSARRTLCAILRRSGMPAASSTMSWNVSFSLEPLERHVLPERIVDAGLLEPVARST